MVVVIIIIIIVIDDESGHLSLRPLGAQVYVGQ